MQVAAVENTLDPNMRIKTEVKGNVAHIHFSLPGRPSKRLFLTATTFSLVEAPNPHIQTLTDQLGQHLGHQVHDFWFNVGGNKRDNVTIVFNQLDQALIDEVVRTLFDVTSED